MGWKASSVHILATVASRDAIVSMLSFHAPMLHEGLVWDHGDKVCKNECCKASAFWQMWCPFIPCFSFSLLLVCVLTVHHHAKDFYVVLDYTDSHMTVWGVWNNLAAPLDFQTASVRASCFITWCRYTACCCLNTNDCLACFREKWRGKLTYYSSKTEQFPNSW